MFTTLIDTLILLPLIFTTESNTQLGDGPIVTPTIAERISPVILDNLGFAVTPNDNYDSLAYEECDVWVNDVQYNCFESVTLYTDGSTIVRTVTEEPPSLTLHEIWTDDIENNNYHGLSMDDSHLLTVQYGYPTTVYKYEKRYASYTLKMMTILGESNLAYVNHMISTFDTLFNYHVPQ